MFRRGRSRNVVVMVGVTSSSESQVCVVGTQHMGLGSAMNEAEGVNEGGIMFRRGRSSDSRKP